MKKILFITGILAAQLSFGQLYTSAGVVNQTSTPTSSNVGIGVGDPHSNLEVGNQNGGKITISTAGWSGTSASPKYPTLEFAGYSNSPKARITATEESGNTGGSKFSILVHDATNMIERLSILQNGYVGIGISTPKATLDIQNRFLISENAPVSGAAIRSYDTYWSRGYGFVDTSVSNNMGQFGAVGPKDNIDYFYIGKDYNNNIVSFYPADKKTVFYGNMALYGKLESKEIKVTLTPTADFVFEENYNLPNLEEVAKHIKEKKHLPEIASAKVMEREGVNVGEFQIKLLQKIEELTLYAIKQERQLKDQQEKIQKLEGENVDLKNAVSEIKQLKEQFLIMKASATH
ncbi:hypothetical protein ACP3T3_06295 [Chryseobacterium sp. CBSDS_008]|uniref:hypothetical protein n=1 Tax=Chryseobacterium sp. CBSDS_008 TaxID=3415265 RepID=UPI003CF1EAEE